MNPSPLTYDRMPGPSLLADNPLLTAPNCYLTPHIAWAPKETRLRLHHIAAENLRMFLNGTPQNVVS